jgi:hypothetical protein
LLSIFCPVADPEIDSMQLRILCALAAGAGYAGWSLGSSLVSEDKPSAVVTVTTTDFAFQAPDTIPAGAVEFHLLNRGPDLHHVWLARLDPDRRAVDVLKEFREGRPLPSWVHEVGGPNVPPPGMRGIVTVELKPGRYALLCLIPARDHVRHLMKGMVKEIVVAGPERPGSPPKSDITIKLVDYDFILSAPLRRGRQVITVRNAARQSHMLVFLRLKPGKTPADYLRWAERHEGPPPGVAFGGTTGMGPGVVNTVDLDLGPGEYGLVCFVPDSTDGKPHVAHGMVKQLRIP